MSDKVLAFQAVEVQARVLVDETEQVRALGERIGFGNMMVLAERLWRDLLGGAGGERVAYCCAAFMVPCPGCKKVEHPGKCDWCCGAGRVTKKVAEAIQKLEPAT